MVEFGDGVELELARVGDDNYEPKFVESDSGEVGAGRREREGWSSRVG